jgi:hypothetical protein
MITYKMNGEEYTAEQLASELGDPKDFDAWLAYAALNGTVERICDDEGETE